MKAKRHQLLEKLIQGKPVTADVEIDGHTYTVQTLNTAEEDWVNQYLFGATPTQMAAGIMTPKVSASLTAIDGISVNDLFSLPADAGEDLREEMKDAKVKRAWVRSQVHEFVGELKPSTTVKLLTTLTGLDEKILDAEEDLGNSSRRITSGGSNLTSSPGKESSLQTQV